MLINAEKEREKNDGEWNRSIGTSNGNWHERTHPRICGRMRAKKEEKEPNDWEWFGSRRCYQEHLYVQHIDKNELNWLVLLEFYSRKFAIAFDANEIAVAIEYFTGHSVCKVQQKREFDSIKCFFYLLMCMWIVNIFCVRVLNRSWKVKLRTV